MIGFGLLGAVLAAAFVNYWHPNTVTMGNPSIQEYIDGNPLGASDTIIWKAVFPGNSYFHDYNITNTGNAALNITIWTNLQNPWILAWSLNGSIWQPNENKGAPLILSVPASAINPPANWGFSVNATEA